MSHQLQCIILAKKKRKKSYAHSIRTHIYVTLHLYTYAHNIVTDQTVVPNCHQTEVQHV